MNARRGLLLALLLLPCAPLAAQTQPDATEPDAAQADATQADAAPAPVISTDYPVMVPPGVRQLGERFELLVRGPLEPGDRLEIPGPPPGVEVGARRLEATVGGPVLHQPLRVTREGDIRLELQLVKARGDRLQLPTVQLKVVLDLPAGHVPQVAAALPPVTLPGLPPWVIATGLLAGLSMLLAGLWLWRRRERAPQPVAPPRPADEVAAEALARLRARLPRVADEVPPFVTEVSDVLRTYIEQRFGVHAPESTTEEFLSVVAQRHDALASRREALAGFLTRCDLVKFARHRPEPAFALPLLEIAERFVVDTRVVPEAAAPAGVVSEAAA